MRRRMQIGHHCSSAVNPAIACVLLADNEADSCALAPHTHKAAVTTSHSDLPRHGLQVADTAIYVPFPLFLGPV